MTSFSGNTQSWKSQATWGQDKCLSMLFWPSEMYNNHVCKPVTKEHRALSTVQNRHWTGFHTVGAAPGLTPSNDEEGGLQGSWSPGRRHAGLGWRETLQLTSSLGLVGSKAVGNLWNVAYGQTVYPRLLLCLKSHMESHKFIIES